MKRFLLPVFAGIILFCGCLEQKTEQAVQTGGDKMKLTSSAFEDGQKIPSLYTADEKDISPPLAVNDVPQDAKSLVLIMDDPDAPIGTWDHWIVFDMPVQTAQIPEGTEPEGIPGRNSWGRTGYGGPAPPSGTHRYFFKLYALDKELGLKQGAGKKDIENAMKGHVLAEAQLMGKYSR
jgi:Raf kinase inhibitor-like YbhB/YbcL family protein